MAFTSIMFITLVGIKVKGLVAPQSSGYQQISTLGSVSANTKQDAIKSLENLY